MADVRCLTVEHRELCPAIAEAFARQVTTEVEVLIIEDAYFCNTLVLGPACDRPGLQQLVGVTVERPGGSADAYNAWRADDGRILIYDSEPRLNATDAP